MGTSRRFLALEGPGKIVLITMIIFFQLLITTRDSARKIDREIAYSLRSPGGNRLGFFFHAVWPVSLPGIFTSLRIGVGTAVAVLFLVESIATSEGLGFYIIVSRGRRTRHHVRGDHRSIGHRHLHVRDVRAS